MWKLVSIPLLTLGLVLGQTSNEPLVDWLSRGGTVGVLAFVVVAFVKRWIVTGSELREVQTQRDRALDLVYTQAGLTERATELSASLRETLDREIREGGRR